MWYIQVCSVVPECTERSRTCKARQNDACYEWITKSAEARLTLLEFRTGVIPVFFNSLIVRRRVGFLKDKSLPWESGESEIRMPRTKSAAASFPVFSISKPTLETALWSAFPFASPMGFPCAETYPICRLGAGIGFSTLPSLTAKYPKNTSSSRSPRFDILLILLLLCE